MGKRVFEIDGRRFEGLEGFYDEITERLGLAEWGRNLDAFNDVLRGGFGTPEGGFVLRWVHAEVSRERLGFPATVRFLEEKLTRCHPTNVPYVRDDLEAARSGKGPTLFEILVDIIGEHGPDGEERDSGVELELVFLAN